MFQTLYKNRRIVAAVVAVSLMLATAATAAASYSRFSEQAPGEAPLVGRFVVTPTSMEFIAYPASQATTKR